MVELPRWAQKEAEKMRKLAHQLFICVVANLYHCGTKRLLLLSEVLYPKNARSWSVEHLVERSPGDWGAFTFADLALKFLKPKE